MKDNPQIKITYRGIPGHFCCSHRCMFHLNTLIEYGNKRIVVSTVGLMLDPMNKDHNKIIYAEIGVNRYYETVAFWAKKNGDFWDANIDRPVEFDSPWAWSNLSDETNAEDGHRKVVQEMVDKLLAKDEEIFK
jgi:hypothetical protein